MADGGSYVKFDRLKQVLAGDVYDDGFTRGRYATDASIYQMIPHAVVVPKSYDDIKKTVQFCRENGLAVLPRGGGTSQNGQTVNHAVVLDNT
ncbi:MAG: FAD-binding protein, partial [Candidatus Puniceispirillum sp.]